jgi:hypothetical protein
MSMLSAPTRASLIVAALLTAIMLGLLAQPAGAQQTRLAKVPLSSLTAQGFEVKAAAGNQAGVVQTLVLQKANRFFCATAKTFSIDPVAFECWQLK